jgi:hypothetical protein
MQISTALNVPNTRMRQGFGLGASLALDLTSGNQTLDPRITFTRTSNATVTNSAGQLVYAPHNLLTFSEQFDNAVWSKGAGGVALAPVVTANAGIAPDGTATADQVVFSLNGGTSSSDFSWLTQLQTISAGLTYAQSVWMRTLSGTAEIINDFDSLNDNKETVTESWQRFDFSKVVATGGARQTRIGLRGGSGSSLSATILIWGAQLNVGSLQPYYPTTVKNLLGFTQEFANAAWTKTRTTISANVAVDPQGFMTADKLVDDTTASATHFISVAATRIGVNVISIYAKKAERDFVRIASTNSTTSGAFFNLSTGQLGTTGGTAFVTASIVDVGNGWYRCSMTTTDTGTVFFGASPSDGTLSYTGDGTSGIFIWGAQISDSASLDPYVYNPGAAPAAAAYFGPRFDYDPVTLAPKGLLIEEQRTNLTPYSRYADTQWILGAASVGTATKTAIDGATVTAFLTDTTTAAHRVNRVVSSSYTANAIHTFSFYVAKPATSDIRGIVARVRTSAGGQAVAIAVSDGGENSTYTFNASSPFGANPPAAVTASDFSAVNVGNGWTRITLTTAVSNTNTTFTQWDIGFSTSNATDTGAGTANSQLFIDSVQLESGSFSTSYIPTTTATATRAADVAVMTGANFSNWYNAVEGTVYFESQTAQGSGAYPYSLFGVDTFTRIFANYNTLNRMNSGIRIAGTFDASVNTPSDSAPINTFGKGATAYKVDDFGFSWNGAAALTDTSTALPTILALYIGGNGGLATNFLNGHIRRIAYYPRRLANAELQGITS